MSPDQAIARTTPPPAMSSVYELPVIWRTMPDLTAVSIWASAASNCSWVSVRRVGPQVDGAEPDRVAHLGQVGHLALELVA